MKPITVRTNLVIHLFALAHALVSLLMRHFGLADDIPLTLLTITMILIVGSSYSLPLEVSAAMALLFCFAGFYMGTKGAEIIAGTGVPALIKYSNLITTFMVTEILGWTTYIIARRRKTDDEE